MSTTAARQKRGAKRARGQARGGRRDRAGRNGRAGGASRRNLPRRRLTIVEDGRLLPCVLGRRRLGEPLQGQLDAGGNDERGDAVRGGLEHLRRLILHNIEARAAGASEQCTRCGERLGRRKKGTGQRQRASPDSPDQHACGSDSSCLAAAAEHAELCLHAQQKIASAAVQHSGLRVVGSLRPVLGRRGGLHARRRVAAAKHCAGGLDAQRPAEEGGARRACEHGRRKTRNWRVKKTSSASSRCTRQADANVSPSGSLQSGRNNLRVRRTREAMSRRGPRAKSVPSGLLPPTYMTVVFTLCRALEV